MITGEFNVAEIDKMKNWLVEKSAALAEFFAANSAVADFYQPHAQAFEQARKNVRLLQVNRNF